MSEYAFGRAAEVLNGAGRRAALPAVKEVFVTRRVQCAVAELVANGASLDIAAVARRASLRITTVQRYSQC